VLGVVNQFPRWQHHRTKCHNLRCKIYIYTNRFTKYCASEMYYR